MVNSAVDHNLDDDIMVAAVFITDRFIKLSLGNRMPENRHLMCCSRDPDLEQRMYSYLGNKPADFESCFKKACADLIEVSGGLIDVVTIGSTAPLKSTATFDRDIGDANYGQITDDSYVAHWRGMNLYELAISVFANVVSPENIFVRSDCSLSALGEYYFRAERDTLLPKDKADRLRQLCPDPGQYHKRMIESTTLAYVKLSSDINGGFVYSGHLLGGMNHPVLSIVKPCRMWNKSRTERDPFPGICTDHTDCYSGLASSEALKTRLRDMGEKDDLNELPTSHWIWSISAYYTAHLCISIISQQVPTLIILGGRLIHDRLTVDKPKNDLAAKVRNEVALQLRLKDPSVQLPSYPEPKHLDWFIQRERCLNPGLYGALIFGALYHRPKDSKVVSVGFRLNSQ